MSPTIHFVTAFDGDDVGKRHSELEVCQDRCNAHALPIIILLLLQRLLPTIRYTCGGGWKVECTLYGEGAIKMEEKRREERRGEERRRGGK